VNSMQWNRVKSRLYSMTCIDWSWRFIWMKLWRRLLDNMISDKDFFKQYLCDRFAWCWLKLFLLALNWDERCVVDDDSNVDCWARFSFLREWETETMNASFLSLTDDITVSKQDTDAKLSKKTQKIFRLIAREIMFLRRCSAISSSFESSL